MLPRGPRKHPQYPQHRAVHLPQNICWPRCSRNARLACLAVSPSRLSSPLLPPLSLSRPSRCLTVPPVFPAPFAVRPVSAVPLSHLSSPRLPLTRPSRLSRCLTVPAVFPAPSAVTPVSPVSLSHRPTCLPRSSAIKPVSAVSLSHRPTRLPRSFRR